MHQFFKASRLLATMLIVIIFAINAAENPLRIEVKPQKTNFLKSEPIGLIVEIENISSKDVEAIIEYPYEGSFTFSLKQPDVRVKDAVDPLELAPTGAFEMTSIKAKTRLEFVYYLNYWMDFGSATGKFELNYIVQLALPKFPSKSDANAGFEPFKGTFELAIIDKNFNEEGFADLYRKWPSAGFQRSKEIVAAISATKCALESKKLLSFVRERPFTAKDTIYRLRNYFSDSRARDLIEKIAEPFNQNDVVIVDGERRRTEWDYGEYILSAALVAFEHQKANEMVSRSFILQQLQCKSLNRQKIMLSFLSYFELIKCVGKRDLQELTESKDETVSRLAKSVVLKIKDTSSAEKF